MLYKIYVQSEDGNKFWLNKNGGFFCNGFTFITEKTAPAVSFDVACMIICHWQRRETVEGIPITGIHLEFADDVKS